MKSALRLRAFAKINLGLKIVGKRADGYHEIRTVFQTVALCDRLEISLSRPGKGIVIECDDPTIPAGRGNLVHRACELWQRARGFRGAIHVRLTKRIPVGAGLGGASSDAAATLLGLERLTGDRMESAKRARMAAKLGSDVPFFLWGGRVLAAGRGEEIHSLPDGPRRRCLIVFPGFGISTAEAYREAGRLAPRLTKSRQGPNMKFLGARSPFPRENGEPAENDFERVVFARWPELARLKHQLIRAGAEMASLTGSGSAVFALFASAQQLARATPTVPVGWRAFRTRTLPRREYQRLLFVRDT